MTLQERELMQMAKRVIAERICSDCDGHICCWADGAFVLNAIDAALAQPEQEPVAWMDAHDPTEIYYRKPPQGDVVPLYLAPPKEIK